MAKSKNTISHFPYKWDNVYNFGAAQYFSTGKTPQIVDKSEYRSDSDLIKDFIRSHKLKDLASSAGLYDYKQSSPKKRPEEEIDDRVLNLRSKSLDMTEVSDAIREVQNEMKDSHEAALAKQAEDQLKKKSEARELAVDKALGLSDQ